MFLISQELNIIIVLMLCGIIIGFIYDVVRLLRIAFPKSFLMSMLFDAALVLVYLLVLSYTFYITSALVIKIIYVIIIIISMIIYFIGPSKWIMRLNKPIEKLTNKVKGSKVMKFLLK